MRKGKKPWKNIAYILVLLAAIVVLFHWYSTENSRRTEIRNLNYAVDSARQSVKRIEGAFTNGILRLRNYAYLLGTGENQQEIDVDMLNGLEENSVFDAIRYTDANGNTLASSGMVVDGRSREYYSRGMQGESGLEVIFESPSSTEAMITFYTPLHRDGKVCGVLLGLYFAEDYLQGMLETSYFGEKADVYLCTQDGRVIASSGDHIVANSDKPLLDSLLAEGVIDAQTAEGAWKVFRQGEGEAGLLCGVDGAIDNLYVAYVPDSNYVMVQAFPDSVTTAMVNDANYIGMILQGILIGLFALYIIVLLFNSRREKLLLERENQELGYVLDGINAMFARFVLVDLQGNSYQYLAGTKPQLEGFPSSGRYEELLTHFANYLTVDEERRNFLRQLAPEALVTALSGNANVQYEYQTNRNGAGWEHMNVTCIQRDGDRASKVLLFWQDVTLLKENELRAKAEIALANRKERQYRIAITSSAVSTFEFNLTQDRIEQDVTGLMDGNQVSLLETVGLNSPCKASDFLEKWKACVLADSIEEYNAVVSLESLRGRFAMGESEVTLDYWFTTPNQKQMCIRQSFIMTQDDDTKDIMVMVVAKDITTQIEKQREQTQALKEALLQAQHANNAKTTFLSNMSHDIRTPMNAIIGFSTIAVSHIDNKDQVRDCLQKVLSSSNHLLSLINDILDMSRIESGKVQIKEQECNISELTHNLVNIIQPQVKAKQMELFIDTFDVENEDVIADPLKLSQVFINLLSNAVKYTPAGGTVSFRITQQTTFHRGYGDYVFIVKDSGIGMSPEFVKHVFEPFERESSTTKTGVQGTGLGMSITKSIVDMMGGEITVQSEKGKGTEFRVRLSLKLQDTDRNAAQIKELEGMRALVVDDDFDSCDSVTRMLKQIGMRAEWTTSGREAVFRAKSARNEGDSYHTYIIDWQMPEISGIETARRIRAALGSEAPIVILTAYDWTDIEEEAKQAGVTAFCAKPLFMSDLKSVLLAANDLVEKEEETASWEQEDFQGKRILLVEDNELNREIAQTILEETGFEVETAPDGTDAVDKMQNVPENYYDAILMDVQMPVMDGYEATRTIRAMQRKDAKDIPIIAMTANAMEDDKENALKCGMNAHLAKPIDIDLFMAILRKHLKND